MNYALNYAYDPRIEAVARAIAKTQGWNLGDNAYSAIQIPERKLLEYWIMAVAAINAYESADR
jgi:hypothetical protein